MMGRSRLWGLILAGCLCPGASHGDGKVFTPIPLARVEMPEQRALLHYAEGTQPLVIETSFSGPGTNFAWILPLPAVPAIEPVTRGLFPTLEMLFRPTLIHRVLPVYLGALWLGALAWLLLNVRASGRLTGMDLVAGIGFAAPLGLLLHNFYLAATLSAVVLITVYRIRHGRPLVPAILWGSLLSVLVMVLCASMSLKAGVSSTSPAVTVHGRQQIGAYETATLSSTNGVALIRWLEASGFVHPDRVVPVLDQYAREGWVFVAARLHRDPRDPDLAAIHPLAFTFPTEAPVYPLRLTGVDNEDCRIDLYIFGPGRAQSPHFAVAHCEQPDYPAPGQRPAFRSEHLRIRHPRLRELAGNAPVATKLSGRLSSRQMQEDARITWQPFTAARTTVYSKRGAFDTAANWGVPMLVIGLLAVSSLRRCQLLAATTARRWKIGILAASVAAAVGLFWTLPKTSIRLMRHPAHTLSIQQHRAMDYLRHELVPGGNTNATVGAHSIEQARVALRDFFQGTAKFGQNAFTGGPLQEEDSPGNYILRPTGHGLDLIWFDAEGAEWRNALKEP